MPRHHGQRQDHLVLDELRDIHCSGREHTIDLVLRLRNFTRILGKLQLDFNVQWNHEGTEAALANQPYLSLHRNPKTLPAVARRAAAQTILETFCRALYLPKPRQILDA